jgi:hypothetical protein
MSAEGPRLTAAPPTDRQQLAMDRRLALVRDLESAPPIRTLVSPDGITLFHCPACRHNGYPDRHVVDWAEVTVEPAPHADRRVNGERWHAKFADPNIPWVVLAAGLTDHQASYAFSENARVIGVSPQEREAVCGIRALDDLNDPLLFAAWFTDDPSGWTGPEGGAAA